MAGVIPFIRNLSSPVLAANLILDKVPELAQEKNLRKSVILEKDGVLIGIIGYLTAETRYLAPKNNVDYEDEVIAITREVKKLKSQGVEIIIALGHSGFIKDLEIARYVEDIDLVIGGHSNTFLWNSPSTNEIPEVVEGPYPVEVRQNSGRIVRVVQAYAYTKYLGSLNLIFDSQGEIIQCDGTPILLDQNTTRDPDLLKMVEKYRSQVDRINNVVVGTSSVALHGEYCRIKECNIGNVITDSLLYYTKEIFRGRYHDVNIAIVQGGRIRTSIDRPEKPFEMTRGDWVTVIPFSDTMVVATMNGSVLLKSLEHAVKGWRTVDSPGQFLQISGMRVTYDLAKPSGSRVVSAQVICSNCEHGASDIREDYEYKVIMCLFLAEGGDGFSIFEELPRDILSFNEVDSVIYYLSRNGVLSQKETGRIHLLNSDKVKNPHAEFVLKKTMNSSNRILTSNTSVLYTLVSLVSFKSMLLR